MDDSTSILIALAVGILLVVGLFALLIPEPSQVAVVALDRLDIAVLQFANSSSWPGAGDTVRARTETKLVNTPGMTIYSRTQLDQLLTEQALGAAGLVDQATAARIGSLIGVNKLVTGAVYSVQTTAEETTVCEQWQDGDCIVSVPAIRHHVRLLAQTSVLNAHTGQIERATDLTGSASDVVKVGSAFSGYDPLIAEAADEIAEAVASVLSESYTRELRYGLYRDVRAKRQGFIGEGETQRFSAGDREAHLIVHFTRVTRGDGFTVRWVGPGGVTETVEDLVARGAWRDYRFDLSGRPAGRYTVVGTLNGIEAFRLDFLVGG
jgi:hypothetical protein